MKNGSNLFLVALTTIALFPNAVEALPKNCNKFGKFFLFEGYRHCVQTLTASSEGAVINVFSPLPKAPKSSGYDHHQYRVLDVNCRRTQNPKQARITLVETRSVNAKGKILYENREEKPIDAYQEKLAWKAFLASCGKG